MSYIKKIYYIENASNNEIYLSYDNKYNNNSIERKLEPNHYDALYSYYIIDTDESSSKFDDMEFKFIIEYKNKHYTITKENINGPTWSENYHRNTNLDHEGCTNLDLGDSVMKNLHYNSESYIFTITDEFMATLTPNEE